MRRASCLALLLALGGVSPAQIGLNGSFVGPRLDYWAAHPNLTGDTNYCVQTAATYASGASAGTSTLNRGDGNGPVTLSGKIFCTLNDGGDLVNSSNLWLYHLDLDMTSAANTAVTTFNQLPTFGPGAATNTPAGWAGQCSGGHSTTCNWKSGKPISVNGWIVIPIFRQDVGAYYNAADATLIASPDGGAHWCNPNTFFAHSGAPGCDASNWSAGGDAPLPPSSSQYTAAPHSGMMWKDLPPFNGSTNRMGRLAFFDYCQDNSCTGMPHNADNFLYAFSQNGLFTRVILARVPKDIVKVMDPAQWSFYNHPGYAPSNVGDGSDWTSTLAGAVDVFSGLTATSSYSVLGTGLTNQMGNFLNPIYLCANGGCSYVAASTSFFAGAPYLQFLVLGFQAPWGPYTRRSEQPGPGGFWAFLRWTAWAPDSVPYHSRIATVWDDYVHAPQGAAGSSMYFQNFDLQLAASPNGMAAAGNTPMRFSMGMNPNSLIRNGLQYYFDFNDHAGYATLPAVYSLDLTHSPPTAQLIGCYTDAGVSCGFPAASKGLNWDAQGVLLGNGYSARLELRDLVQSTGVAPNYYGALSDATFSGNGGDSNFTISAVVKTTDNSLTQGVLNAGPNAQQVYLTINAGGSFGFGWQIAPVQYIGVATANGLVANNTWYNIVATYKAGGDLNSANGSARVKLYLNGVAYPGSWGSYPAGIHGTPNIGAGEIVAGYTSAGAGYSLQGTVAGVGWYNRVLSPAEISHNYTVLKAALKRRAIVLP